MGRRGFSQALTEALLHALQGMQIARNTTTNEEANWTRYKYLHGEDGTFHNPFNRGFRQNCMEALCSPSTPATLAQGSGTPYVLAQGSSTETTSLLRMEEGHVASNGRRKVSVL